MPSLVLLVLRWVTALIPRFGTTFGVGIILSRNLFQSYFSLQGIGMLWWLTLGLFTMMWYIRTLFFSNLCMIRRWASFQHFSMFCILLRMGQGGDDKLGWSPSKIRSFKVKYFYKVLLPTLKEMNQKH
jgi:hypothetical protein